MIDREKVLHGLNSCGFCDGIPNVCGVTECPYQSESPWCTHYLAHDAGELISDLLKAQEPHVITKDDFKNNPNVDENGYLPAYCEKIDRPIGWMAIHKGYIGARKDIRYWTGKPTDEQREAVKWDG